MTLPIILAVATDLTEAWNYSAIGTARYSSILTALAANNSNGTVPLGAVGIKYNAGAVAARAHLVDDHGWTITDAGLET